jgi:hypothetical protein
MTKVKYIYLYATNMIFNYKRKGFGYKIYKKYWVKANIGLC